ncbi:hypothetical protein GYH30_029234 [Glycine max]|uniref:Uncharacterized protein n=1 Tax=Glycine max TaxID=3847 RepID=A0A0R0HZP8_SOYBN|nr:hypothetical protein GYH30_029234 [Glycine max]
MTWCERTDYTISMSVPSRNHYIGPKNQIPTCPQLDNLQKIIDQSCHIIGSICIKSIIFTNAKSTVLKLDMNSRNPKELLPCMKGLIMPVQ